MSAVKILISGDVNGNFRHLFSRVNSIVETKGPFEYLFCIGNFFGSDNQELDDLKSGKIRVPITTYVLGPNESSHVNLFVDMKELPGIIHLGKSGIFSGVSGIKIAYVSGVEKPKGLRNVFNPDLCMYFSKKDVEYMVHSVQSNVVVDVLITSQWPAGVLKHSPPLTSVDQKVIKECSSPLLSELVRALKPKYHFSGLVNTYFERLPYRNDDPAETTPSCTRFVSLASVKNPKKEKWLVAYLITPKQQIAPGSCSTPCPYDEIDVSRPDWFFREDDEPENSGKRSVDEGSGPSQPKKLSIEPSKCWFCFTNSDVQKQLVISVGTHCYVTLPKGVLIPEHVLIVPIEHLPKSVYLPNEITEELEKFKKSLVSYFHDKDKDVVFFERYVRCPHLNIQAVPVPKSIGLDIVDTLLNTAKEYGIPFIEIQPRILRQMTGQREYFYFEVVCDKEIKAKYLHVVGNKKFPLQFGRMVLAKPEVLDVEDRIDWQGCTDPEDFEREMAEKMRMEFAPYDFTVQ